MPSSTTPSARTDRRQRQLFGGDRGEAARHLQPVEDGDRQDDEREPHELVLHEPVVPRSVQALAGTARHGYVTAAASNEFQHALLRHLSRPVHLLLGCSKRALLLVSEVFARGLNFSSAVVQRCRT